MIWGLSHLFYPWGFLLQILALVHVARRRPDNYWIWIILFGGFLGAAVYIKGFGRRSRIQQLEAIVLDNPAAGNYEELADLLLDQKRYERARECYDKAIAARADSLDAFYRRGLCSLALDDLPRAIDDLDLVTRSDPRYDHDHAAGLLAHAYALSGRADQAEALFAQVTQLSNLNETHYNYACFLKSQGRAAEARAVAQRMLDRKRGMPRYLQRLERPWFRKAKAVLKET
jgi:hypothetical protein